jgi:hypothetical protein
VSRVPRATQNLPASGVYTAVAKDRENAVRKVKIAFFKTRSYYRRGKMLPYGQKLLLPLIANIKPE